MSPPLPPPPPKKKTFNHTPCHTVQNIIRVNWSPSFGMNLLIHPTMKSVQQVQFQHFDSPYTELAMIFRSTTLVEHRYVIHAAGTSPCENTIFGIHYKEPLGSPLLLGTMARTRFLAYIIIIYREATHSPFFRYIM